VPSSAARFVACVATGVAMVLGAPDTGWWWLGFVGWVPWLWAIDGQSPRRALLYGQVAGVVTMFGTAIWMATVLERFAGLPLVPRLAVHAVFAAGQGLQWAGVSALFAWLRARTGASAMLLGPLCWVAGEAIAPHLFPTYSALLWCWHPRWLQLAEVGGVTMVGAAQVATNAALYVALRAWVDEGRANGRAIATLTVLLVGLPLYGDWRIAAADRLADAAPTARFGVVQGNHGVLEWRDALRRPGVLARLQAESAWLAYQGAEVIVWGENAYPYKRVLPREGGEDYAAWDYHRVRRGFSAALVLGAITGDAAASPYPWNSALVLGADGRFGDVYDKVFPLWFGEHAPLVDPGWYVAHVKGASHVNAGTSPRVLRVGDWRLGPLICYEDILPRFARAVADEGVHAFVNLTSDTWFGRTSEQDQHLGLAVLRSIEHRRAMVRAVNAGPSAIVDPAGRVVARTAVTDPDAPGAPPPVADGLVRDVPMIDPAYRTPYARTGEGFDLLAVATLVLLAGRRGRTPGVG
jgi:apolipoprotein N-acyltransferase